MSCTQTAADPPALRPSHRPTLADTNWKAIQEAETSWLATFAPRRPAPRPPSGSPYVPTRAELLQEARRRMDAFEEIYRLLTEYGDTFASEPGSRARATFRLGLYADIRLRFLSRHSLSEFADVASSGVSPEAFEASQVAFREELARLDRRAARYRAPEQLYQTLLDDPGSKDTTWGAEALRIVVQRAIELQPSADIDVPDGGRDLLGQSAAQDIRNQVLGMLNSDQRLP